MAVTIYDSFKTGAAQGQVDLLVDDVRVLIVTSAYVPDATHDFVSDVVAFELVATNYVRKSLASKMLAVDVAHAAVFSAASLVWTSLGTSNPFRVVLFKQVTNDADSPLISCIDLASAPPANGGNYTVSWDAAGIIRFE